MLPLTARQDSLIARKTHRHATCWKIERTDATVMRFTDHDAQLTVDGESYVPAGGWSSTAERKRDALEGQDMDIVGMISSDAITTEDLRQGRYNGATITRYDVDWRYPWAGPLRTARYWLAEVSWNGVSWRAELRGMSHLFEQRVGRTFCRNCNYDLGDSRCGIDLVAYKYNAAVVSSIDTDRVIFAATHDSFEDVAEDYFAFGKIAWQSGDNDGTEGEIAHSSEADGTSITFTLRLPSPTDIDIADTFDVYAGCDKLSTTCKTKFDNIDNFGGFHLIPGQDKVWMAPW